MNPKLERYYNYIVDDLVKDTEFGHSMFYSGIKFKMVKFPWGGLDSTITRIVIDPPLFNNYVISRYGVNQDELRVIGDLYKKKMSLKVREK